MDLKDIKKEIKNLESEILKMSKELKMKQNILLVNKLNYSAKSSQSFLVAMTQWSTLTISFLMGILSLLIW